MARLGDLAPGLLATALCRVVPALTEGDLFSMGGELLEDGIALLIQFMLGLAFSMVLPGAETQSASCQVDGEYAGDFDGPCGHGQQGDPS